MVFYFTGTGNSLYAARMLDDDCRSIPQAIHDADRAYRADRIGIVCPVYGHEVPQMVRTFIRNTAFETDYFYMVLTYGKRHGGAVELAEQMLAQTGKRADYITTLLMIDNGIFTHPVLTEIGQKYGKTAAQIALKWNAQRGVVIIPKSVHMERMQQNIDIWDFTLTDEDMKKVDALDLGHSEIINHNDPNVVKFILGSKIHD